MECGETITFGREEEDITPLRLTLNSTRDGISMGMTSVHDFELRINQKRARVVNLQADY